MKDVKCNFNYDSVYKKLRAKRATSNMADIEDAVQEALVYMLENEIPLEEGLIVKFALYRLKNLNRRDNKETAKFSFVKNELEERVLTDEFFDQIELDNIIYNCGLTKLELKAIRLRICGYSWKEVLEECNARWEDLVIPIRNKLLEAMEV